MLSLCSSGINGVVFLIEEKTMRQGGSNVGGG